MNQVSNDPIAKYYPIWIENCKASIQQLSNETEWNDFLIQHNTPPLTKPQFEEKIQHYRESILRYEAAFKKAMGE